MQRMLQDAGKDWLQAGVWVAQANGYLGRSYADTRAVCSTAAKLQLPAMEGERPLVDDPGSPTGTALVSRGA